MCCCQLLFLQLHNSSAYSHISLQVVGKPPRQVAKDPSMQPRHHVFSAKRADPAEKV
jgi:hypothetical protein